MGGMISVRSSTVGKLPEAGPNLWRMAEPIIYAICDELNVTPLGILSSDRHAPLPQARQLAAWLLYRRGWLGREIGDLLSRESSTVYYYLRNVERRRMREWETARLCSKLNRRFPVRVLSV